MTRLALIQTDIFRDDIERNHISLENRISEAVALSAHIVVLPEMFNTGFSFTCGEMAKRANSLGLEFMKQTAKRHELTIIGTLPDPQNDSKHPFNTMYVVAPSGVIASYSKIHLFTYGGETGIYRAGNQLVTVQINNIKISLFICYDLRFPNVFYELAPQTDVYIISANWPASRQLHWETLLRARAIENLAYVAGVNRVGKVDSLVYSGGSQIVSPIGDILAHAGDAESVVYADINTNVVRKTRQRFSFLQDRRTDINSKSPG